MSRRLKMATVLAVLLVTVTLIAGVGGRMVYASWQGNNPLLAKVADAAPPAVPLAQGEEPSEAEEESLDEEPGLVIVSIVKDGPAATAGVARGDILLQVDGQAVNTVRELHETLAEHEPGDTMEVQVQHGDELRTLTVTLGDQNGRAYLGLVPFGGPNHDVVFVNDMAGAMVRHVEEGSPAEAAGLQEGDVIQSVNDQALDGETSLTDVLDGLAPGDSLTLEIQRPGEDGMETIELFATLGEDPDEAGAAYLGVSLWEFPGHIFESTEGAPFTFGLRDRLFAVGPGVVVSEVITDSPAARAGLQEGDLITSVDGEALHGPRGLEEALASHEPGDSVTLEAQRPDEEQSTSETLTLTVQLGENPDEAGAAYLGIEFGFGMAPDFWMGEGEMPFVMPVPGVPFDGPTFNLPEGETVQGAIIEEVTEGSAAQAAGVQAGDLVTAVDGETLDSPEALAEAISSRAPGDTVTLTVLRAGEGEDAEAQTLNLTVTLGEHPDDASKGYLGVMAGFFVQITNGATPMLPSMESIPWPGTEFEFAPGGEGDILEFFPAIPEFEMPFPQQDEPLTGDSA